MTQQEVMAAESDVRPELASGVPDRQFAWRGVSVVAVVAAMLLLARIARYPFWGDELYFMAAGRRPAVSYVDQGPLVPLLAWLSDLIAPGSVVVLRLLPVAMTVLAIVLSALIAREFGGGRGAQTLAAFAYATTPFAVTQAAVLSTFAFDATLTALVSWLVIRWVRTRRDRLLIWAGVVAIVDLQVKWLIPAVWVGLAIGVAVAGPREMLRRPAWWLATAGLAVSAIPSAIWQWHRHWPQLAMGSIVRAEEGGPAGMPLQLVMVAGPIGLLLLVGMGAGVRSPRLRPFRFLVPLVVLGLIVVVAGGLRAYYLAGAFPGLFAAGAVYLADREHARWARFTGTGLAAVAAVIAAALVLALPLPSSWLHSPAQTRSAMDLRRRFFGPGDWHDMVAMVADDYRRLPSAQRAGMVIMTQNYWQAAALDELGAGLPAVYSPNRGYGYFDPPPDTATTVLYVGVDDPQTALRTRFATAVELSRLDHRLGMPGIERGVGVWECRGPATPWSTAWPRMRTMRLVDGTSS